MTTLRYGIIGCGVIGPVHANALSLIPQAHLAGVCDIRADRAEALAQKYTLDYFTTDYHALLARPDIDAVCVCVPHYLHAEVAIAAANAGKQVFCEKPMAIDPGDMDAMIAAADAASVQLGICFQHRFDPMILQLKQWVDEGRFGQLLFGGAHCYCFRGEKYYNSETWRGTWEQEGGGVLINQAIHTIDLMMWLLGDATAITGTYSTLNLPHCIEVEDTATGFVNFANGAQGSIIATNASNLGWRTRLQIFGTEGSIDVNTGFPSEVTMLKMNGDTPELVSSEEELPNVGKVCYGNSHVRALQSFTECVLEGRPYPINGHEGRRAAEVVLGLYRSSRAGRPIALPLAKEPVQC